MKKISLLSLSASCCALALTPFATAESRVSVDLGLRIGPPPPVVVHRAPPRPMPERIVTSPGPGYVWINGHQTWRGNEWVWTPGMWVRPPQPGAVWVDSRWDDRSQTWIEGYWNVQSGPTSYPRDRDDRDDDDRIVMEAPPAPRREVRVARPGRGYVWISGYWVRRHRHYEWVPGHWELPPRGHGRWVNPRWERRGGSYVFIEGSWR